LEKYFDKINHDRLIQRLSKGTGDKRLLRLIHQYLKAGMMTGGWWRLSKKMVVSQAMNLHWFSLQGLKSLKVRMLL